MSPPSAQNPLEAARFGVKFFAAQPFEAGLRAVVPIFHGWIQRHVLDDELLIDVADYAHVHHGPGVLLLSHEGQYSLDEMDGRLGLRYSRRRKGEGNVTARLSAAFRAALRACRLLQEEPALTGKLCFRFDEAEFHIHDRLLARRSPEVFGAVKRELGHFLAELYEGAEEIDMQPAGGQQDPFTLHIRVAPPSAVPAVDVLVSRVESLVA
jgi:hypothetical protein